MRCKRCNKRMQPIVPMDVPRCLKKRNRRLRQQKRRQHSSPAGLVPAVPGSNLTRPSKSQARDSVFHPNHKCYKVGVNFPGRLPFMMVERKIGGLGFLARHKRSASTTSFTYPPLSASRRSPSSSSLSSVAASSSSLPSPQRVCSSEGHSRCCVLAIPVEASEQMMGVSIVAPTTLLATSCEERETGTCPASPHRHHARQQRRRNRVTRGGRRGGGGGGRRRKGRQWTCTPVESQALDIWFFDRDHQLNHASLPGLVVSRCDCRRRQ